MRRLAALLLLAAVLLCGCGQAEPEMAAGKKWDCSVVVPVEDSTVIVFNNERLQTKSGELSFQNRNAFPVHLYLYKNGFGDLVTDSEIQPGGVFVFLAVEEDVEYTVGFHTDQPEGTPITIMAYDGNAQQEPYEISQ